jgi:hypothetical protein
LIPPSEVVFNKLNISGSDIVESDEDALRNKEKFDYVGCRVRCRWGFTCQVADAEHINTWHIKTGIPNYLLHKEKCLYGINCAFRKDCKHNDKFHDGLCPNHDNQEDYFASHGENIPYEEPEDTFCPLEECPLYKFIIDNKDHIKEYHLEGKFSNWSS